MLAERNQAVVAVGAWVEDGQDFLEHPSVSLAFKANVSLTSLTVARLLRDSYWSPDSCRVYKDINLVCLGNIITKPPIV